MPGFPVADAHVDVLYRMEEEGLPFVSSPTNTEGSPDGETLQASLDKLNSGGVLTQVFALYVSPAMSSHAQMEKVLRYIDMFYSQVCHAGDVEAVTSVAELETARQSGAIAGLLSIEGGGCLRGDPGISRIMHQLGVVGMGLTWNPANDLADGCGEPRGGGLTQKGIEIVREMAKLNMWVDIAHLSDRGVQDVFRISDGPVLASHANSRAMHEHRRNLTDEVIRELVARSGWIGLTFEGSFLNHPEKVEIKDVIRHLDHILDLGGQECVGFGSDFDGLFHSVPGLVDAGDYSPFSELIVERYGEELGRNILFGNFERFLRRVLPGAKARR